MATWTLAPDRANLHGHFSRDLPPLITINSGDTVEYSTFDAAWHPAIQRTLPVTEMGPQLERPDKERDAGHCLVGPIAVRGAKPGMTLEVKVEQIVPGNWGWTAMPDWPHRIHLRLGMPQEPLGWFFWSLDGEFGQNQDGHRIKLRPFMGVMGMPADEPGIQPTAPPRATGGNLDCKEIVAGTSLFLPIEVEEGLFSVGDGHAAQGDGESSVTAIECPMELVRLTFILHADMSIPGPRVRTPGAWITLGVDEDLHEASMKALDDMLDIIAERFGVERVKALALASVAADLRVTQLANGVLGVHAVLEDDAISIGP